MRKVLFTAISLPLLLLACAAEQQAAKERDGERYGVTEGVFRGRWWSYYERGASYLSGEYYAEAIADFEEALSARSADSWRARTYGLHFVEYFPNRELGVAYFHTGDLEKAEAFLQRSLEQVDTARAHYYLDEITRAKIARGILQDSDDPRLTTNIAAGALLTTPEVLVDIDAQDDIGVASVALNGRELPQRGSAEALAFERPLLLDEGPHQLELAATDLAGKAFSESLPVVVDLTGPNIGILHPTEPLVTNGAVTLKGVAVDRNGIALVALGDETLVDGGGTRVEFEKALALSAGENHLVLRAVDRAGNETRTAVDIFVGDSASASARLWLYEKRVGQPLRLASKEGVVLELLVSQTAEEAAGIHLKSPQADRPYRHNKTLRVSGDVVSDSAITSITINNEPLEELAGAPKESFNRRLPVPEEALSAGGVKMPLDIKAQDSNGNVLEQTLEVDVRPVELTSKESHMPVAVLAFQGQDVPAELSTRLRVGTETALFEQGRFRVLDRVNLQDVLTEQQLASALADPDQAITLGKLTNAHVFLVADIFNQETQGVEIKARAINTETTDVVATLDVFITNRDSAEEVQKGCENLAAQLAAVYPRLSGEVMSVRGEDLLLNWQKEDGIKEGTYALVVQETEPWLDEETGEVLEPGELVEVARARLVSILTNNCKATTVERKEENVTLDKGMPAVTM